MTTVAGAADTSDTQGFFFPAGKPAACGFSSRRFDDFSPPVLFPLLWLHWLVVVLTWQAKEKTFKEEVCWSWRSLSQPCSEQESIWLVCHFNTVRCPLREPESPPTMCWAVHSCSTQKYGSVKPFQGSVGSCLVSVFPSWPQRSAIRNQRSSFFPASGLICSVSELLFPPPTCCPLNGGITPATVL